MVLKVYTMLQHKFFLEDETEEGGFEMELPLNRFRTCSVAMLLDTLQKDSTTKAPGGMLE